MTGRSAGVGRADVAMFGAAGAALLLLLMPIPGAALDALLALNLGASLLLASAAVRATTPLRALPSALLLSTFARLALEVAATRAILTRGDAGALIPAVGRAALGGDWVVGTAVFAVLVAVQYMVVAKGAERVAEVAARFALDALPGRQMSLDAAVRAGLVDATGAARERDRLADDSAFHAAMDGAMKFVRGDALAGALIAAVNLVGGATVGVLHGETVTASLARYGALAVGQGLLAQVPSLLCAVAAALAVTRVGGDDATPNALARSLLADRAAVWGAAALVLALGLLPGLPMIPFALAGVAVAVLPLALPARRRGARLKLLAPGSQAARAAAVLREGSREVSALLGCGAPIGVVESATGWSLRLDGVEVARCEGEADARAALEAVLARRPSRWFGVDDARAWLDALAEEAPALVGAAVPARLSLVELTELLRALLDAGAPIAPQRGLLERVVVAPRALSPAALAEHARAALSASISARWARGGAVRAMEVAPLLADAVLDASGRAAEFVPGPTLRATLREALQALGPDAPEVVVTSSSLRAPMERALRAAGSDRVVLSFDDLAGCEVRREGSLGGTQ